MKYLSRLKTRLENVEYLFWGIYIGLYTLFEIYWAKWLFMEQKDSLLASILPSGFEGLILSVTGILPIFLVCSLLLLVFTLVKFLLSRESAWIFSLFWSLSYLLFLGIFFDCSINPPIRLYLLHDVPTLEYIYPIFRFSDLIYVSPIFLRSAYKSFFIVYKFLLKRKRV